MTDGRGDTEELRSFRRGFYGCLRRRADALFELTDAMLTSGTVPSPVHLSLLVRLFPTLGDRNAFRDVSCTPPPEDELRGRGVHGEHVPEAVRQRHSPARVTACVVRKC